MTPAAPQATGGEEGSLVTVTIDGRSYRAPAGATLMDVAAREQLGIAGLCASPHLRPYGSCRLCVVQVEGQRSLSAACTTPVREGMVATTDTPDIRRIRRTLLQLYLAEHPPAPRGSTPSDLHRLAAQYGADAERFRYLPEEGEKGGTGEGGNGRTGLPGDASVAVDPFTHSPVHPSTSPPAPPFSPSPLLPLTPSPVLPFSPDETSPYFSFDPSRCILCARCVRACEEIQGQGVLHLAGRGARTRIGVGDGSFRQSECVTCGACVTECPSGALADRRALDYGPPESVVRTTCAYCGVGCQFDVERAGGRIIGMRPADDSPVNAGHACVKGRYAFDYITSPDRLRWPLVRVSGKNEEPRLWREASWEEAIALIARRFRELLGRHGADAVACISSSRGTNEENYLYQKFARACLGNNHIDNCARVCHSATVAGMQEVLGTGAATNSLADIERARLLLIVGCNPTEGHPVAGARIKRAARRGTRLIVIDPREIELARCADVHLQLRPGTNVAVLNGLAHVILKEGLADERFIAERTENLEAFRERVREYPPERVAEISGVPPERLRLAARLYATSGASMAVHGLGITEHRTGSYGVMALANLAILTGNVGRPGTGINPLRGQNNVQGSCDMGALPNVLPGYAKVDDAEARARFEAVWGRPLPSSPGWKLPEMYEAAVAGRLRALWVAGYDVAHTDPNSGWVRQALGSLDFLVVSDLFLSETAKLADVVLPAAGALEKDGTFTNGERRIQRVRKAVEPPGGARAEWQVLCELATAMGYPMRYSHPAEIMEEIARLVPYMAGVSYERLEGAGLQWPVRDARDPGTGVLHAEQFPRGRARFAPVEYLPPGEEPDGEFPFVLTTGRVLQHYNAGTMTRRTRLVDLVDRDFLELHPDDAAALGLAEGDSARVTTRRAATVLTVRVSRRVAPGDVFTAFHFPEGRVNALVSSSADVLTRCPEYKVQAARVERAEGPA